MRASDPIPISCSEVRPFTNSIPKVMTKDGTTGYLLYGAYEQRTAGYILSGVRKHLTLGQHRAYGTALLKYLSVFEIKTDGPEEVPTDDAVFAIASNLISRGEPTIPSLRVERALAALSKLTDERTTQGAIDFPVREGYLNKQEDTFWRALVPIDPRFSPAEVTHAYAEYLDSEAERSFLSLDAPEHGGPAVPQLLWPQRPLSTLVGADKAEFFQRQGVDFASTVPALPGAPGGLVVEIDGSQHGEAEQSALDRKRDALLRRSNLRVLRQPAARVGKMTAAEATELQTLRKHSYIQQAERNVADPIYATPDGRRWLQALLAPLVVARVQKTLVDLVRSGHLNPEDREWNIVIVERDVPGAALAIDDFQELIQHLYGLEGERRHLPKINLRVYRSEEFATCELGRDRIDGIIGETPDPSFAADALLDVSILQRPGLSDTKEDFLKLLAPAGAHCTIRSAYAPRTSGSVAGGYPIAYDVPTTVGDVEVGPDTALEHIGEDAGIDALVYFLQNVFRKERFRPHQLDVISRALHGDSVIGLLPTGAGKSLCYQLAALLQPGTTIVVAPLKSLMHDQDANLKRLGITSSTFLNSSLATTERVQVEDGVSQGQYQFVFVAPERFMIKEFREVLRNMKVPVSYCIIDEAHCVSEWGHDFRTSYLQLATNVRAHCQTHWPALPLIGLTGTASFDVLSDVRRELNTGADVDVVTPSTFRRDELRFEIRNVPRPAFERTPDAWTVRKAVMEQKQRALIDVLRALPRNVSDLEETVTPEHFLAPRGRDTASGLIFTPHANGDFGVQTTAHNIRQALDLTPSAVASYASSDRETNDDDLRLTQEAFKDNEVSLLVATKAFGMGIDKPNIRFTVHLNMSQSIESFYQEAGRAGRDRDKALCCILYCDQQKEGRGRARGEVSTVDRDMLQFFHESSFKGSDKEYGIIHRLLHESTSLAGPSDETIMHALSEMAPGDTRTVTIDFMDDSVKKEIEAYLVEHCDTAFGPRIVSRAIRSCRDSGRFSVKLMGAFKSRHRRWPKGYIQPGSEQSERLAQYFRLIRHEDDTFKALYRLSIIGVIEDYTVDYNARVFRATLRKRAGVEYIEELQRYIERYVAPERARKVPEEVLGMEGDSILEKCLQRLVGFVYDTIARKRRAAIDVMEEAVQEGAAQGSAAFERRVNTYFNSRYLPELQKLFPDLSLDLSVVWYFIEATEGTDDNVNHLRGACDRLLGDYPNSAVLYLLRAFTRLMTADGDRVAFLRDFRRGWEILKEEDDFSREDYLAGLHDFHDQVLQYDADLGEPLNEEVTHAHVTWLERFTNEFLSTHHA